MLKLIIDIVTYTIVATLTVWLTVGLLLLIGIATRLLN